MNELLEIILNNIFSKKKEYERVRKILITPKSYQIVFSFIGHLSEPEYMIYNKKIGKIITEMLF